MNTGHTAVKEIHRNLLTWRSILPVDLQAYSIRYYDEAHLFAEMLYAEKSDEEKASLTSERNFITGITSQKLIQILVEEKILNIPFSKVGNQFIDHIKYSTPDEDRKKHIDFYAHYNGKYVPCDSKTITEPTENNKRYGIRGRMLNFCSTKENYKEAMDDIKKRFTYPNRIIVPCLYLTTDNDTIHKEKLEYFYILGFISTNELANPKIFKEGGVKSLFDNWVRYLAAEKLHPDIWTAAAQCFDQPFNDHLEEPKDNLGEI